ncbi:hypothetical protein [Parasphingopyxis marina]|uniref:Lipoprotein n=1 Tax=Parasphingopyxis marina TaxID=2761622 RepID=A0A842HWJ7_9SPHN|nr:hypothetical protein [Parasphingopyxis marina]MBC2776320.1 hypothetical protein [Parasphingopyxis marina]
MNRLSLFPIALALPLGLAACTSAPEAGDFAAACNATGNLNEELCDCLDAQAQNLSPETHEFVIATIAEDEDRARELALGLDSAQQLEAGQYLSIAIQQCIIELPETS